MVTRILLTCAALFVMRAHAAERPRIIVSKETTYITEPLGEDGLPDYRRALLERMREGIRPEDNGARLYWQAVWPGELDAKHYELLCSELRMELPDGTNSLLSVNSEAIIDKVAMWLLNERHLAARSDSLEQLHAADADLVERARHDAKRIIDAAAHQP